ncbi:MAG: hypothetical protein ACO1SX_27710 [Actinomycetota bacterium]
MDVLISGEEWELVVECKSIAQPATVRTSILLFQSHLGAPSSAKRRYGVLMAPFISRESARLCEEAGVGYVDLAGNARLAFGPIYIETRSAENPFREQRENRPLFTPKAGRVLRTLLAPPLRAWKVTELQHAASVSLGHVSTVRRNLLDRGWAQPGDSGLRVTEPQQLLRAWRTSYKPNHLRVRTGHTLLHGSRLDAAVKAALKEAENGAHAVCASYSAGRWLAPYARHATQFFYADRVGWEALERRLELEPAGLGENVVIWEPWEDDVFSGRIEAAPGVWCTGLVQTWLDLAAAGERGEEAAEHLLREVLEPEWEGVAR